MRNSISILPKGLVESGVQLNHSPDYNYIELISDNSHLESLGQILDVLYQYPDIDNLFIYLPHASVELISELLQGIGIKVKIVLSVSEEVMVKLTPSSYVIVLSGLSFLSSQHHALRLFLAGTTNSFPEDEELYQSMLKEHSDNEQ